MKNKIIIFVISLFAFNANAQTQKVDSSIRQLNFGLNLIGLVNSETWNATPIGSVKLRFGNHAYRFSGFSHYISQPGNTADNLVAITTTDSTITNTYQISSENFSGISLGMDFFKTEKRIKRCELYGGVGLFYGTNSETVSAYEHFFRKDSTGVYRPAPSKANLAGGSLRKTFNENLGVCTDFGFLYNPKGLFSLGFEVSAPFYISRPSLFHHDKNSTGGSGFEMFYSVNFILNLDMKKFMKKK